MVPVRPAGNSGRAGTPRRRTMDPTDLVPGYGYPEEQEDLLIIARELLRAVPTLPERRL